ncbi:GreA/GreB family elongation factor [Malikia granosa]|uniref:Transcription elongation factor GreAB n=1 Tax=Malikia granosa TaxID=263067 RepID=A0A2S9K6C7_9BURK|nr:GreA/GreB family elongation factor [Malikia granosa]PRD65964.1 transcription elongation factor GreAB [Malikia granosa]
MQTPFFPERVLTELDHARLNKLGSAQLPQDLADELQAVDLVSSQEIAPDVVTMNSELELVLPGQARRQRLTLCYPRDAQPSAGRISVLSPIGMALLGRRVGDTISWSMPNGEACQAELAALLFQPEASGDYTR